MVLPCDLMAVHFLQRPFHSAARTDRLAYLLISVCGCRPVTVRERPPSRGRTESDPDGAGVVCSLLWNIEKVETRTKARHVSMEKAAKSLSANRLRQQ